MLNFDCKKVLGEKMYAKGEKRRKGQQKGKKGKQKGKKKRKFKGKKGGKSAVFFLSDYFVLEILGKLHQYSR